MYFHAFVFVWVYVYHYVQVPMELREGVRFPETGVTL